jgi:hypothetical protein
VYAEISTHVASNEWLAGAEFDLPLCSQKLAYIKDEDKNYRMLNNYNAALCHYVLMYYACWLSLLFT